MTIFKDLRTWHEVKLNELSPEEARIILDKWTELPGTGEYDKFDQKGTYLCKQCEAPLYRSSDKFDAHCGWPSFDDAIPGAVKRSVDADGSRTEISCARCGGHLGHVFIGEQLTNRNTRHCVNSASLKHVPQVINETFHEIAVLGGGCFRCMEAVFQKLQGVHQVQSGYAWWDVKYPTYEQVTKWTSGHAEVVRVFFDPKELSYEQILEVFFTLHDPTTLNKQWPDVGSQYRSVIFYNSNEQKSTAEAVIKRVTNEWVWEDPIVTELSPLDTFWIAEGYHQDYFNQHPNHIYCMITINPKLTKLRQKWGRLMQVE